MMLRAFIFGLATFAVTEVYGLEAPIPGYGVVPFSWEVQASAENPPVVLNGTVEEVHAQLLEINPNYEFSQPSETPDVKLAAAQNSNVICDNFPPAGSLYAINQGITYLRGVNGKPRNGPGPGNCGRVSCSKNSAIWWCNDSPEPKVLPSFNNIADGAQVVMNNCEDRNTLSVAGQEFHADDWNVILRRNEC